MKKKIVTGNVGFLAWLMALSFCTTLQAQPVVVTSLQTFSNKTGFAVTLWLSRADGALYGSTYGSQSTNGIIFTVNRDGSGYAVLHTFDLTDKAIPSYVEFAPVPFVIPGNDGMLYGTTPAGGANGRGTVFKLNPNGSGYTVIHDFAAIPDGSPANLMQGSDGKLYGAGSSIFKINTDGTEYTVLRYLTNETEGEVPLGVLLQASDGALYGTAYATDFSASATGGSLFKINTSGTGFTVLHVFGQPGDGQNPIAGLIQGSDGALYGTTFAGGAANKGTIFRLNTDGGNYTNLHSFAGIPTDGNGPVGRLAQGSGNMLYGTTSTGGTGGTSGSGTIFKIGMDGNGYASLYNLSTGNLGTQPLTGLVPGPSQSDTGVFYGTTGSGSSECIFATLVNPPAFITPITGQGTSNQMAVFWPAWAAKYRLQSTTNVASSNWVNVADGVPVFGVQVTSTNPAVFYRLVSP